MRIGYDLKFVMFNISEYQQVTKEPTFLSLRFLVVGVSPSHSSSLTRTPGSGASSDPNGASPAKHDDHSAVRGTAPIQ